MAGDRKGLSCRQGFFQGDIERLPFAAARQSNWTFNDREFFVRTHGFTLSAGFSSTQSARMGWRLLIVTGAA